MAAQLNTPLLDLNSNDDMDLLAANNIYLTSDDNVNPYENLNIHSKFYDISSFSSSFCNSTSSIFLNINIQSLTSKIDNLKEIICSFANHNINIPVIALQEIWQIPFPEALSIPGYKLVFKQRSIGRGGGGFFLHQNIPHKILPNLSPFVDKTFESPSLEIIHDNEKKIISNIHRPPSPLPGITPSDQITSFIDKLDSLASDLSTLNLPTFVFSDSNLNLLNISTNHFSELYMQTQYSNGLLQTILKSTRFCNATHSLIDHISTNIDFNSLSTGVIVSDLSDPFY
jgi:hypothetical protein